MAVLTPLLSISNIEARRTKEGKPSSNELTRPYLC